MTETQIGILHMKKVTCNTKLCTEIQMYPVDQIMAQTGGQNYGQYGQGAITDSSRGEGKSITSNNNKEIMKVIDEVKFTIAKME